MRGLFGPASTKEASNKPAENRDRRLKFNSDTIESFESYHGYSWIFSKFSWLKLKKLKNFSLVSLGHAKSWCWGREFEQILNFFFKSSRAVLFSEGQKNICWASLDVEFHKLSNCFFKNALSLFFTGISWFKVSSDL